MIDSNASSYAHISHHDSLGNNSLLVSGSYVPQKFLPFVYPFYDLASLLLDLFELPLQESNEQLLILEIFPRDAVDKVALEGIFLDELFEYFFDLGEDGQGRVQKGLIELIVVGQLDMDLNFVEVVLEIIVLDALERVGFNASTHLP